jgi:hypothetical protein
MKMIWIYLLASAMYALGYHVGKDYQKRKAKEQADDIHDSVAHFIEASQRLKDVLETVQCETSAGTACTDTIAKGPLPIKPGETDAALRDGELAIYAGKGGNS